MQKWNVKSKCFYVHPAFLVMNAGCSFALCSIRDTNMVVPYTVYSSQQKGQMLRIYTWSLLPLFTNKMWHEESSTYRYLCWKKLTQQASSGSCSGTEMNFYSCCILQNKHVRVSARLGSLYLPTKWRKVLDDSIGACIFRCMWCSCTLYAIMVIKA